MLLVDSIIAFKQVTTTTAAITMSALHLFTSAATTFDASLLPSQILNLITTQPTTTTTPAAKLKGARQLLFFYSRTHE